MVKKIPSAIVDTSVPENDDPGMRRDMLELADILIATFAALRQQEQSPDGKSSNQCTGQH